jgi:hypothetical protein
LAGNPTTSLPRVAKAAPAYRSAKDRPGPRTPALGCAMSRSQYPTANSIIEAAAKHGINVRIEYVDGRIASVETIAMDPRFHAPVCRRAGWREGASE